MKTFTVLSLFLLMKMFLCLPLSAQDVVYSNNEGLLQGFADLAIIRVDTGGEEVDVLALSQPAAIGEKVYVIGHPQGFYYHFTDGMVANNYMGRAPGFPPEVLKYQMAITADYATGASGGAVLNEAGQVVGVVSTTRTLHVNVQQQPHAQMVVKQSIPVIAIQELISE